jgi:hypothetical protein
MRAICVAGAILGLGACGPSAKTGVCKDSLIAGDLVITEVFADSKASDGGTGADTGKEWFEIYNASDRPLELEGLTITHSRPSGDKAKTHVMATVTIAPGQFFTLGNATPDLVPAYVDYGYSADLGDMFNTDGGKFVLACGDSEIDSAEYELVKEGHSRQLTSAQPPDYTLNDNLANWCEAGGSEFETSNFGTPGSDNDCTPIVIGQCNDGGTMRDVVSPAPGELVITEVMPNPAAVSDTTGEYFEARASVDVDLNGIGLDRAGDSSNPVVLSSPDCIHVAAGANALFAKSTDMVMNGGLPVPVLGMFNFALVDGTAAAPGDVQIVLGATVIDSVTWTSTRSGKAHSLDPNRIDSIANDDETAFCDATMPYGLGDLGSPNADNEACPIVVPAGMCDDGVAIRPIVKPTAGQLVITEVMINPKVESPAGVQEWFEITNTGATAFDVNELGLDQVAGTRLPDVIKSTKCKSVAPAGFALFAHTADPLTNGGLIDIDATYGFTLANTGGDIQVLDGATVLDAVAWGNVSATSFDGKSIQLDPAHFNTTDNNTVAITPGVYCLGATGYGDMMNLGTPRAANATCP